jgi:hypothetical protein
VPPFRTGAVDMAASMVSALTFAAGRSAMSEIPFSRRPSLYSWQSVVQGPFTPEGR